MVNRRALFGAAAMPWLADEAVAASNPSPPRQTEQPLLVPDAIADEARHPLSFRFKTLQDAQAVYPYATDLSDELDWCALQACIDRAEKQGGGAVYVPNTGRSYVLKRTLTVDPNKVTVRSDSATLWYPEPRGQHAAILFRTVSPPMYGHERYVFQGFALVGPSRAPQHAGVIFQTDVEALSSRAMIHDGTIQQFFIGVLFGNRAYRIAFSHVSVFACSLDYAHRPLRDNNGGVDLVGCRLEIAPPSVSPIHCNHGRVNMFGGFFLINGPRDAVHVPELFALSNPDASVHFFGTLGWNWRTTTRRSTNGPGEIRWYEGTAITTPPAGIGHP
jgi:hypothetical protein